MSDFESRLFKSFLKGINAAVDRYNQPQGSVPRASNLILTKRGSLITCDGSQIIHAFNGVPTAGRGRILATFLFAPTGVPAYYIMLANALDLPLGRPLNLVLADGGAGGALTGNIFYKVTALDGVGGETIGSAEATINVAANHKVTLTWNIVPNAAFYALYRSTASGLEGIIVASTLPVVQPVAGTLTATFTDDGIASVPLALNIVNGVVSPDGSQIYWTTTVPNNLAPGYSVNLGSFAPGGFNGVYQVQSVPTTTSFVTSNQFGLLPGQASGVGNGGSAPIPNVDNTQQIVLFKMPVLPTAVVSLPVAYNNTNIVALFPANLKTLSSPTSGGGGVGGGGTSGGGTGGGGGAGPRGGGVPNPRIPILL